MTKQEFLESLSRHLQGQIPEAQVLENVDYYRSYIEREIAAGKSEGEVMDSLGDPWLIAKTLIDTQKQSTQGNRTVYEYDQGYEEDDMPGNSQTVFQKKRRLDLTTWYGKPIVIAAAGLVIFLLITIMSILIPIVLCLAVIGFIIKFFRSR